MACKRLERKLCSLFQWYGELVGGRPFPFLVIPLIFALLIGPALLTMKYDDDVIILFTPFNSPSRREIKISQQFSPIAPPPEKNSSSRNEQEFFLPISPSQPFNDMFFLLQISSPTNVMTTRSWTLISELVRYVYENFTCRVDDWVDEKRMRYDYHQGSVSSSSSGPRLLRYGSDFCSADNGCIQLPWMIDRIRDLLISANDHGIAKFHLTYPVMYVWNRPFNWGQYIFGAKYDPTNGTLKSARVVNLILKFQVNPAGANGKEAAESCVRQLTKYVENLNKENPRVKEADLNFVSINEPFISDEVSRSKDELPIDLPVSIILIIVFIAITSFQRRYPIGSLLGSGMGVLTVGLSLLAATGLTCLCGVRMNFVLAVTPFLVLCVGIDNDFLITSAWRQTSDVKSDRHSSVQIRLGRAFANCGPSLTITSLNDIFCFGIGYLSETPAVADFCLYTCVALFFRFIFQLTFFAAVVAYLGRWESKIDMRTNENNRSTKVSKINSAAGSELIPKMAFESALINFTKFRPLSVLAKKQGHGQWIHNFFGQRYSKFVLCKSVQVATFFAYAIYIAAAVIGAAAWTIDITPQKLFYDNSPLQVAAYNVQNFILKEASVSWVYVTAPPDFRYKSNIDRFFRFVETLENVDDDEFWPVLTSNKADRTGLWLRPYMDFLQFMTPIDHDRQNEFYSDFYDYLPSFLESTDYNQYLDDIRFKQRDSKNQSAPLKVDKFQFTLSYFRSPDQPYTNDDHVQIMLRWREICKNYSDYQAVVYDATQMNPYYDQRLTLAPTCVQTMGIALISVSAVTALLMPDIRSIFFICLSFLSVDVGVIAGLHLWQCTLDPTTLAFVLMTIGFSVYYTARVCYCYQSADKSLSSEEKMRRTMETVGWPILQGAIATILGIISNLFIYCYMVRVFYKTVILVVGIGLAHGLIVMPVIMKAFDQQISPLRNFRQRSTGRSWCKFCW